MLSNRKVSILAAFVVIALLAVALVSAQEPDAAKGVTWKTDYNAGLKEAAKSDKPVMIDFYADWCGWCKKLDKDVYSNTKVVDLSRKFVSLKLDTDKNTGPSKKYKVTGLPTIVFLNSKGKEIHRVVGYRPADQFIKEMNKALDRAK